MRVLVMLPTYNEIENIEDVLDRARAALPDGRHPGHRRRQPRRHRRPGREARRRSSAASRCCAARSKSGLGSAYRAGFRVGLARGYDVMIEMDADLSHDPAVLPDLVAAVEQGADLAIGSRYVPGGSIPDWKWLPPADLARRRLLRAHHARAVGARRHRRVPRLPPRDALARSISTDVRADGYGFQVEMTYLTERNHGAHRRGADHVPRPQPGPLEDVDAASWWRRSCWSRWWARP